MKYYDVLCFENKFWSREKHEIRYKMQHAP